jgi:hypothetical protein
MTNSTVLLTENLLANCVQAFRSVEAKTVIHLFDTGDSKINREGDEVGVNRSDVGRTFTVTVIGHRLP